MPGIHDLVQRVVVLAGQRAAVHLVIHGDGITIADGTPGKTPVVHSAANALNIFEHQKSPVGCGVAPLGTVVGDTQRLVGVAVQMRPAVSGPVGGSVLVNVEISLRVQVVQRADLQAGVALRAVGLHQNALRFEGLQHHVHCRSLALQERNIVFHVVWRQDGVGVRDLHRCQYVFKRQHLAQARQGCKAQPC